MLQRLIALNAACAALALAGLAAQPAAAATSPNADFRAGQTMGVGYAGLAYDYAFPNVSVGASLAASNFNDLRSSRMLLGTRGMVRFLSREDLSAAVVGGLMFDPGVIGGRSFLVPDVGVGVGYRFTLFNLPLALRFNVTLTADQGQSNPYPQPVPMDPTYVQPRGNLLQRLTVGPNTMVGLAYRPTDNLEVTLGSGTLLGVRFTY